MQISRTLITLIVCTFATFSAHGSMRTLSKDYDKNLEAFTQESFAKFKKRKRCPTDFPKKSLKSSPHYRALLFQALKNCNHPRPEIVMLTNDSTDFPSCAGKNEKYGVYVNFDEDHCAKESFGTKRLTMHHEAAHIVKRHYKNVYNTKLEQQDEERTADQIAVISNKCTQCTREYVNYWLCKESHKTFINKSLKTKKEITLRSLDSTPAKEVTQLITQLSALSRKRESTHPLHLERALRIYRDSTFLNSLCHYHQKKQ